MGEAPVGSGVGEVDCRRCAVARGSTCRQWGGSGGLQVCSGQDWCRRAGGSTCMQLIELCQLLISALPYNY